MIKYILFDVDDTLLDFEKCSLSSIKSCCESFGVEYTDELFDTFIRVNDDLWERFEKGLLTREEIHAVRWKMVFEALEIHADFEGFEQMYFRLLSRSHESVQDAAEVLSALSGYTLCVASNSEKELQSARLRAAGLLDYFKDIFVSQEIGYPKPTAKFFEHCMQRLGEPRKDEVLMVGDSLSADICGAVSFGIKSCWFNKYGKSSVDAMGADYEIRALRELKQLL